MTKRLSRQEHAGRAAKHGKSLTGRTRAAILKAMDITESPDNDYKTAPELLAEAMQRDIFRFMDSASKYIVKDITTDVDGHKDLESLTNEELADIVASHARRQREELEKEQAKPVHLLTNVSD